MAGPNRVSAGVPTGGQFAEHNRPETTVQLESLPRDEHGSIVLAGGVDVHVNGDGAIQLLGWAAGEEQNATAVTTLSEEQAREFAHELLAALEENR